LDPFRLLDALKEIEKGLGRQKSILNGPRTVDLDILLYDDEIVDDERLSIPHKRIMEREFVLKPLCEYDP
jgi:2-amino-4-hydroxy-6-hydroxymethyldihydropteridine diphosphokinase